MNNISDEEIIQKYKSGCAGCIDGLITKYLGIIRAKVKNYFLIGGEREDLVQEGLIGLFKAIRDYNPQKKPAVQDVCPALRQPPACDGAENFQQA